MALTDVNLFRIDGTVGSVSNVQTSALNGGPLAGTRNRIINGDMRIDQRNVGASVTPTAAGYGIDRWQFHSTAASKYSLQRNAGSVTPPDGFTNYLGVTSLSAYSVAASDVFAVTQQIEGFNCADFSWGTANSKSVTLSFWVRSSLTGTFGGAISNSAQNRSYAFSYSINNTNTWELKTITIPGETSGAWLVDNGVGLSLRLSFGVGSTFSGAAGSWSTSNLWSVTGATSIVGTNGATFYITGVQLEAGTVATAFERRPYGQELALCQRYFERSEYNAVGPYTFSANSLYRTPPIMYKAEKRIGGCTLTINDLNGNANRVYRNGINRAYSVWQNLTSCFSIANTDTPSGGSDDFAFAWTSSAEL